jgi:hypothetical protein
MKKEPPMVNSRLGSRLLFLWALLPLCLGVSSGSDPQDIEGADSLNWPKLIDAGGLQITVYQPQLESFQGNQLAVRAAVSVQKAGTAQPVFGGVWMDARVVTDRDRRTVTPIDVRVTEARFPAADPADVEELRRVVTSEIPKWRMTLPLDHLMAELKLLDDRKTSAQGLKNDPPRIVYRAHAAVLLTMDGEPSWRTLPGSAYRRIANSSFFVIQDGASSTCYLHIAPFWWTAEGPMGPWAATDTIPGAVQELWNAEPRPELPSADAAQEAPERPEIISTTVPSELIWTRGPAQWALLPGTDLLYLRNSDSDVFIDTHSQLRYVLLSGRWYRKPAGKAPWTYVAPEELPADFGRVPPTSDKGHVLSSVAGTPEARDAVLDSEIPETQAIAPGPAPDLTVSYDGDPQFTSITDSSVQYAVNSPYSVFLVQRRYYCCQDGIWYDSEVASGPWSVCTLVAPDIYLIPPSCPHYYCTYCHVFGSSPDAVFVGYYPGYRGCYVWGRTVVFGTGWHYPSWKGSLWYPRPVTWGCGVRYTPATGSWSFRLGAGGPCAWMGLGVHSDWKGHEVSVGVGGWWGGVGYRARDVDVHRNLNFVSHVDQHAVHNVYARQPERLAPMDKRLPQRVQAPPPGRKSPNNVFTDPKGDAYRKSTEGDWEKHTPQGWKRDLPPPSGEEDRIPERREPSKAPPPPPRETPKAPPREAPKPPPAPVHHEAPPMPEHHVQLEQHQQSRNAGNERAQNFQQRPPAPPPRTPPSNSKQRK